MEICIHIQIYVHHTYPAMTLPQRAAIAGVAAAAGMGVSYHEDVTVAQHSFTVGGVGIEAETRKWAVCGDGALGGAVEYTT